MKCEGVKENVKVLVVFHSSSSTRQTLTKVKSLTDLFGLGRQSAAAAQIAFSGANARLSEAYR
jgi:hypothetical protein